jgi:hypothetical protein
LRAHLAGMIASL